MKREDYISWNKYFMGVALLSAMRSKDPNTQVGACIVNEDKKIVGIGYNGLPHGMSDDDFSWASNDKDELCTKYPYVVHAEPNAILNATSSLKNTTLYVTLFPCNECAKLIIQSGINKIVYLEDKYADTNSVKASKKMFETVGISCKKIEEVKITIE